MGFLSNAQDFELPSEKNKFLIPTFPNHFKVVYIPGDTFHAYTTYL